MQKIKQIGLKLAVISTLSLGLIGCGGGGGGGSSGGSDSQSSSTKSVSGTAIDGYIKNATVCLDINSNDICDNGEPSTTTADDGTFSFTTTQTGNYPIIIIGGIDTATNEVFDGILKNIVELQDSVTSLNIKITPLTTLSTDVFKKEIKIDSLYTPTQAKQLIATNLGLTLAQIDTDPLTDKDVFAKTQQIIQAIKIFAKSIQTDESDTTKNKQAFNHIIKQIALSVQADTISTDLNISKLVTKLETTIYDGIAINIAQDIEDFTTDYTQEIKTKAQAITNTANLDNLQNGFKTYIDDAKTQIANNTTGNLSTTLTNIRNKTTATIINDVNSAPVFTSSQTVSVNENQTSAITIIATDSDNDTLVYSLYGTDSSSFDIDSSSGVVTFKVAPDYETKTSYNFNAIVNDGVNNDVGQPVTITILNLNDNRAILTSSRNLSVDENQLSAITITATDADNDTLVYSLAGADASSFDINSSSGVVTFKVAPDYETKTSYYFDTWVHDSELSGAGHSVTITILDVFENTAPVFTSSNSASIDENQLSAITLVATGSNTLTYSISGTDSGSFSIDASSGVVTFKVAPDFETKTSYSFVASVNDGTNSVNQNITITILDISETTTTTLYIKSAIYNNNSTATPNDDKLYLYFNKNIDSSTITTDTSANYDLNGTGAIGSTSLSQYDSTLFYRHKISLNSNGTLSTALESNSTKISLASNTITDINGSFPSDLNQTLVQKFNVFGRLKTGQTTSYQANDDGATQRGIERSYTNNGDDTVTDNNTNLMWQDNADVADENMKKTWEDAKTYCTDLSLAGHSDWYLPSIEELVSISDKGRSYPSINPAFSNVVSSRYWSSLANVSDTSFAWCVFFHNGGNSNLNGKSNTDYVRCVRPAGN